MVVLGSGGHARVCLDILLADPAWEIVGCVGPAAPDAAGIPVSYVGGDSELPRLRSGGVSHAFVAIGDNVVRGRKIAEVREHGLNLASAVSSYSVISTGAQLGTGVAVMPGAVINFGTRVGDGAIVNTGATIDHDCTIGVVAHIAPGVALAGGVHVGEGAFMGVGSCAIPGVSVGEWSVVGAGAVVVRDVPPRVTVAGVPARLLAHQGASK